MSRQVRKSWTLILVATMFFTGCHPMQPFYFEEDGDLSHYIDEATSIDYPDVEQASLAEVEGSIAPRSIINPTFEKFWDLTLEETLQLAMRNSKIIRSVGGSLILEQTTRTTPNRLTSNPGFANSVYDTAIQESDPNTGVEAALSAFDAQLNMSMFWERADRPQNVDSGSGFAPFTTSVLAQDLGTFQGEITKRAATGTTFFFRNNTIYDKNNRGFARLLPSDWVTNFEAEARHPLLRGGGTQVNRIPIVLARLNTDISLASFEASVRDFSNEIERAYWELYFYYRNLQAAKAGLDSTYSTYKTILAKKETGARGGGAIEVAQAETQYHRFRAAVEETQANLFRAERRLRQLMGITPTDDTIIRPKDEPTVAKVTFDWPSIQAEALQRSVELRQQKYVIKQRELELIAARNQLLPQFDLVALYRVLGAGDDLIESPRKGLNFPTPGSLAFDELFENKYQEWQFGFQGSMPLGFRRELAGVRNRTLQLAKDRAVLDEMELELSFLLSDEIANLENQYALAGTNYNAYVSSEDEVKTTQILYEEGGTFEATDAPVTLDELLAAQQRRAEARSAYYTSLVNYNLAIMQIHSLKGSLLEYNNVYLSEGPWSGKAYFDAHAQARRRDASYYLDYGYTRPKVVNQGTYEQHQGLIKQPTESDEAVEEVPTPAPLPKEDAELQMPTASRLDVPLLNTPSKKSEKKEVKEVSLLSKRNQTFEWGDLGGLKPSGSMIASNDSAAETKSSLAQERKKLENIKQVAHQAPKMKAKPETATKPSTNTATLDAAKWNKARR